MKEKISPNAYENINEINKMTIESGIYVVYNEYPLPQIITICCLKSLKNYSLIISSPKKFYWVIKNMVYDIGTMNNIKFKNKKLLDEYFNNIINKKGEK